ncbi:hypothetical protein CEXT_351701 [Caerostris extrusa]|uniref:Uncharacterized protein n=1 Tax=Caerostris extrusa TaxID=172846 RepID=A0AAV4V8C4_CAEEX|nr:hypothetical protein CEXT_351701 [Caerostris extrusa]
MTMSLSAPASSLGWDGEDCFHLLLRPEEAFDFSFMSLVRRHGKWDLGWHLACVYGAALIAVFSLSALDNKLVSRNLWFKSDFCRCG